MRNREITVGVSTESVAKAIAEINEYIRWLKDGEDKMVGLLADVGAREVDNRFALSDAVYDGKHDYKISVTRGGKNKASIKADGDTVCFLEFGAGVVYGGGALTQRPSGVVGIGEYGHKQGRRSGGWTFKDGDTIVHTLGNPPASGFYYAEQKITQEVSKKAEEAFRE